MLEESKSTAASWVSYVGARSNSPAPSAPASVKHDAKTDSSHHGGALSFMGIDAEQVTSKTIIIGGAVAGTLILAPVVLPWLADKIVGGPNIASSIMDIKNPGSLANECCMSVGQQVGLAENIAIMLEKVPGLQTVDNAINSVVNNMPVVGAYLSKTVGVASSGENMGALHGNVVLPALTVLTSYGAGSLMSKVEKDHGGKGTLGAIVRTTGMIIGVVLALPTILPGIGHGIQYLSQLTGQGVGKALAAGLPESPPGVVLENADIARDVTAGFKASGLAVARVLGNTDICPSNAVGNAIKENSSLMISHIPCAIPAFALGAPVLSAAISRNSEEAAAEPAAPPSRSR